LPVVELDQDHFLLTITVQVAEVAQAVIGQVLLAPVLEEVLVLNLFLRPQTAQHIPSR
jgi:hypothetical protein